MNALVVGVLLVLAGVLTVVAVAVIRTGGANNRAVLNEFAFFTVVALLLTTGILVRAAVVFDFVLIAALLGLLSALSLSRFITRGGR